MILKFDVEAFGSEYFSQLAREGPRGVRALVQKIIGDRPAQARRGRDDAGVKVLQHLQIDARPVVETFQTGAAGKLQEVAVAGLVLGEQKQVVVLALALGGLPFGEIRLHADDGIDARLFSRLVPNHRRIHNAVVGHRHVRHSKAFGLGEVIVDPSHSVQQRELGVKVEMREIRQESSPRWRCERGHGDFILLRRRSRKCPAPG